MVQLLEMPLAMRQHIVARRVGLLMLATDHTAELEFSRLVARRDIGVYTNRVPFANPTTPENLQAMLPHISTAAEMLLPGSDFDVIYYGCTSASVVIGNAAIIDAVRQAKPSATIITPTTAALKAFARLNVKNIAILTPYLVETSEPMVPFFGEAGMNVVQLSCLGMEDDREMARLDRECLIEAARRADHRDAECLFISCTALRAVEIAGEIEDIIGKPVVTSNQAAIWQCLGLLGLSGPILDKCQLFTTPYTE